MCGLCGLFGTAVHWTDTAAAPGAFKAVLALETYVSRDAGLDPALLHLVKLRASQINGCTYCVDMHTREARAYGLGEQWIALVCVWREAAIFSARERAALAWTETVTRIADAGASDADYEEVSTQFSDDEVVKLTVAIGTINVWNRLAVSFRAQHAIDQAA